MPFTFFWLEIKSVGTEALEDVSDVLAMGGEVRGVDEDVVEVDHNARVQHVGEDAIDKVLERGRGISETERHYQPLEGAIAGVEGGLPFVFIGDATK